MNKQISFYIKEDLAKQLEEYSQKNMSSRSRIIQLAIKQLLEKENGSEAI